MEESCLYYVKDTGICVLSIYFGRPSRCGGRCENYEEVEK